MLMCVVWRAGEGDSPSIAALGEWWANGRMCGLGRLGEDRREIGRVLKLGEFKGMVHLT